MNLNQRWLDYIKENNIDGLFFYNPDAQIFMTVYEGTGDNLLPEDEAEGNVDYWMVDVFSPKGNIDGSQVMRNIPIREDNWRLSKIIDYIEWATEFELGAGILQDYLIDPKKGNELEGIFQKIDTAIMKMKMAEYEMNRQTEALNNAIAELKGEGK